MFTAYPGTVDELAALLDRAVTVFDARHLAWIFKRMLAVIGFAQTCGLVHGAVLPPHVMLHAENHGLQLLDLIHAVRIGAGLTFIPTAYRDWYPARYYGGRQSGRPPTSSWPPSA